MDASVSDLEQRWTRLEKKIVFAYQYTDDLIRRFFSSTDVREFESIQELLTSLNTGMKVNNLRIKKFGMEVYRSDGDGSFRVGGKETDLCKCEGLIALGNKTYFTFEEAHKFVPMTSLFKDKQRC